MLTVVVSREQRWLRGCGKCTKSFPRPTPIDSSLLKSTHLSLRPLREPPLNSRQHPDSASISTGSPLKSRELLQ
jgi:hypothetical protein